MDFSEQIKELEQKYDQVCRHCKFPSDLLPSYLHLMSGRRVRTSLAPVALICVWSTFISRAAVLYTASWYNANTTYFVEGSSRFVSASDPGSKTQCRAPPEQADVLRPCSEHYRQGETELTAFYVPNFKFVFSV